MKILYIVFTIYITQYIVVMSSGMCYYVTIELIKKEGEIMATNPPSGDGHRNGMVRERSQAFNSKTQQWVKRDTNTGRFMDVKQDGTPFKGVRKEK